MNSINIIDNNCTEARTGGGIQAIFYIQRNRLGQFWYYTQTHNLQYAEIIGNSNLSLGKTVFIPLKFSDDTANFTQAVNKDISRVYEMSLTVNINSMSQLNRDKIEQLDVAETVVVIFCDMNNRYWLMGETDGCFVNSSSKTETIGGRNDNTIVFTCTERYPIRALSANLVALYLPINQLVFNNLDWPGFIALSWAQFQEYVWDIENP